MTRVEILYNFYTSASRISINGQPISAVSALSRFQTLPFRQWYDQLLDVVEREVNDDFSLRLLARPVEGQLLQPLAAACPACRSYQRSGTPLDDPALRRLKHLSQRISTGAVPACPRQKFTVRLYCADPAALLRDAGLAKLLPRLAFCRPELQVLDIKALAPSDADATIVVTDTEPDSPTRVQLARCASGTACAVHLGGRGTPAAGDIYFCSAPTMADLPGAVGIFWNSAPMWRCCTARWTAMTRSSWASTGPRSPPWGRWSRRRWWSRSPFWKWGRQCAFRYGCILPAALCRR